MPKKEYYNGTEWVVETDGTLTSITAGTGLDGGTITDTGTISLSNTTVIAGDYQYASITVDEQGRISSASTGTAPVTDIDGTVNQIDVNGTTISLSSSIITPGDLTVASDLIVGGDMATPSNLSVGGATTLVGNTGVAANFSVGGETFLSGEVDVNNSLIRNVATPLVGADAANKNYVDNAVETQELIFTGAVTGTGQGTVNTTLAATQNMTGDGLTLNWGEKTDCNNFNVVEVSDTRKFANIRNNSSFKAIDKTSNLYERDTYDYRDANNIQLSRLVFSNSGDDQHVYYSLTGTYTDGAWTYAMGIQNKLIVNADLEVSNGNLTIPVGTTEERPANPVIGMVRINTSL